MSRKRQCKTAAKQVKKNEKHNTSSKETEKVLRKQVKRTDNGYCMKSLMNTLATIAPCHLFESNSGSYIR